MSKSRRYALLSAVAFACACGQAPSSDEDAPASTEPQEATAALTPPAPPTQVPVDYDPSQLAPGQSAVIYYKSRLALSSDTVRISYGFQHASLTLDAAMTLRSDGFWASPPIALPAGTTQLTFAFNDGLGSEPIHWDFNGANDWELAVTPSGGVVPPTPVVQPVQSVSQTQLALSWPSFGATSFTVARALSSSGPFTAVATTTFATFTDSGLNPETAYFYRVTAANASGPSPASATVSGRTYPDCSAVPVKFTIKNANTVFGQDLYVVGKPTQLGNWKPANGFHLTIQGSGANATWSGTTHLPANASFEYKYVKYNRSTGQAVWESNQSTPTGNRVRTPVCSPDPNANDFNDGNFKH